MLLVYFLEDVHLNIENRLTKFFNKDKYLENETLKKVVGTAGVESARRTREQWNYMPVLCYMRFSPYSIRVKLNRFADPNKKYSCIFYIDDKAIEFTNNWSEILERLK